MRKIKRKAEQKRTLVDEEEAKLSEEGIEEDEGSRC